MSAHNILDVMYAAKAADLQWLAPPSASGGTIDLKGNDFAVVRGNTSSSQTWKLPVVTTVPRTIVVFVTNVHASAGTLTITNTAGTTIDTVAAGEIIGFILSGNQTWKSMRGMSATQVSQLAALVVDSTGTERIGVPLVSISKEDGTQMIKQASTTTGFAQLSNKNIVIHIPANSTAEAFAASIGVPANLEYLPAGMDDIKLNVVVSKSANNDTLTFDAELYAISPTGGPSDDGYSGAAKSITGSSMQTITFTPDLSEGWLDGAVGALTALAFVLTLGGTNDQDVVYIHDVYWSYRKKLLTS